MEMLADYDARNTSALKHRRGRRAAGIADARTETAVYALTMTH
jgi:hypothetical protein